MSSANSSGLVTPGSHAGLRRFLALPHARVMRLEWNGRPVWLKRPEQSRSLRWRLQKGDPAAAFRREIDSLRALVGLGVPVPRVLDAGPDFLFLDDAGETLQALLADPAPRQAEARRAVTEAARVLARLHARGLAHGRPYLRDICWDGQTVRLIDFERFRLHSPPWRLGYDLVLFLASLLRTPAGAAHFPAAVAVIRDEAPEASLRAAARWIGVLRVLRPLARLALRLRPGKSEVRGYLDLVERWSEVTAGPGR